MRDGQSSTAHYAAVIDDYRAELAGLERQASDLREIIARLEQKSRSIAAASAGVPGASAIVSAQMPHHEIKTEPKVPSELGGLGLGDACVAAMPIPVTIHATGNIASIAVAVFLGAQRRLCSKHVLFMVHPTSVPGSTEGMTWSRLEHLRAAALAEEDRTEGILSERSSIPQKLLKARRIGDVHFSPEDAVKFGIAHAIEEFSLPQGANICQI